MAGKFFRKTKWAKIRQNPLLLAAIVAAVIVLGGVVVARVWYANNLRPVSQSQTTSYFTVETGTSVQQIATNLKRANLIRSQQAFITYVRSNEFHDKLQAGTYILEPSMSVQQIVKKMVDGDVAKNLLTILPGKRLDEIKAEFSKAGYSDAEIATAFNPDNYRSDHPALASLPAGASLEGYLYPDSFQKQADTPAATIVGESLDEMQSKLTADIVNGFAAHGLSIYQGITLASIVYAETDNSIYEPTVAQVFYSRLNQGINLESNVTANYAADIAGVDRSTAIDSPYNTYLHGGLPPGPINNMASAALKAVAHPDSTDYLYFVADENTHQVYFAHTQDEHNAQAQQYCPNTCQ